MAREGSHSGGMLPIEYCTPYHCEEKGHGHRGNSSMASVCKWAFPLITAM